ncbi:hypothetical protein WA158_001589 [Blastocystis sp. Blastoise]
MNSNGLCLVCKKPCKDIFYPLCSAECLQVYVPNRVTFLKNINIFKYYWNESADMVPDQNEIFSNIQKAPIIPSDKSLPELFIPSQSSNTKNAPLPSIKKQETKVSSKTNETIARRDAKSIIETNIRPSIKTELPMDKKEVIKEKSKTVHKKKTPIISSGIMNSTRRNTLKKFGEIIQKYKDENKEYDTIDSSEICIDIENALFRMFPLYDSSQFEAYTNKFRNLCYSLNDPDNPELRYRVFTGEVTGQEFCSMTSEELANREQQKWKKEKELEYLKENVLVTNTADDMIIKKTHKGIEFLNLPSASIPTTPSVNTPKDVNTPSVPVAHKEQILKEERDVTVTVDLNINKEDNNMPITSETSDSNLLTSEGMEMNPDSLSSMMLNTNDDINDTNDYTGFTSYQQYNQMNNNDNNSDNDNEENQNNNKEEDEELFVLPELSDDEQMELDNNKDTNDVPIDYIPEDATNDNNDTTNNKSIELTETTSTPAKSKPKVSKQIEKPAYSLVTIPAALHSNYQTVLYQLTYPKIPISYTFISIPDHPENISIRIPDLLYIYGKSNIEVTEKWWKESMNAGNYDHYWAIVEVDNADQQSDLTTICTELAKNKRVGFILNEQSSIKIYFVPPAVDNLTAQSMPTFSYVANNAYRRFPHILFCVRRSIPLPLLPSATTTSSSTLQPSPLTTSPSTPLPPSSSTPNNKLSSLNPYNYPSQQQPRPLSLTPSSSSPSLIPRPSSSTSPSLMPRPNPNMNPQDHRYPPRYPAQYPQGYPPRGDPRADPRADPRYPRPDPRYPRPDPRYARPPYDPRARPPYDPRVRPPYDPRARPPYDPRARPPNDQRPIPRPGPNDPPYSRDYPRLPRPDRQSIPSRPADFYRPEDPSLPPRGNAPTNNSRYDYDRDYPSYPPSQNVSNNYMPKEGAVTRPTYGNPSRSPMASISPVKEEEENSFTSNRPPNPRSQGPRPPYNYYPRRQ